VLVTYEKSAGVATVSMDDGKVNVMSTAMLRELTTAFERAEKDGVIVILTSARQGIFSAGFDTKILARRDPQEVFEMIRLGAELAAGVLAFPRPVVAACPGHAYPMGAFLLLASDIRIGADGPYRIGLNEVDAALGEYLGIAAATSTTPSPAFAFLAVDVASKTPEVRAAFTEAFTSISEKLLCHSSASTRSAESCSLSTAALIVGALAVAYTTDNPGLKAKLLASCKENVGTLLGGTDQLTPTFFWEPAYS
jgi:Enoyl-CoA hydratase/isomerase